MDKITKDLIHLTTTITSHNIPPEIIDIRTLENNVNNLQALLLAQIKTIEMADNEQCLFFDLPTSPDPMKIPTFSGTFSEDFKTFEKIFNEAAKDNKVSKTDQPGVLKSALRGNARECIYLGPETSIDQAWAKLNDAYGNPQKGTYRWTPDQRRRILEGRELKDNINTPQPAIQEKEEDPKNPPSTTPQGTQTISEPLKLTTSTQTKTPRSKIHYQAKHGSSITKRRWSSRKVTTSSRVSFFCTVVLHQRSNRPRSTVILELKNTTPEMKLHPPTTPSSQIITCGLNKNKTLENEKQSLATNTRQCRRSPTEERRHHEA